eukprot:5347273-Prymnesium_polylepis.1
MGHTLLVAHQWDERRPLRRWRRRADELSSARRVLAAIALLRTAEGHALRNWAEELEWRRVAVELGMRVVSGWRLLDTARALRTWRRLAA